MRRPSAARTEFIPVCLSLADLLGQDYIDAVVAARSKLTGERVRPLRRLANERVDFFPRRMQQALAALLPKVGRPIAPPAGTTSRGASTAAFEAASRTAPAPLAGWGCLRAGEDGRLYFISKSEHYHAPLGHSFPGYRLLDHARRLGIPNATHNNTRGHVARLLEEELVRAAGGRAAGGRSRPGSLSRVLNLETGSLAAEAGVKMMLARFHKVQAGSPEPPRGGRVPVLVVIGDDAGGLQANYHGTTIADQLLRGMWPTLREAAAGGGFLEVVPVRPNDIAGLEAVFRRCRRGRRAIAGFIHEIILMNYGGRLLSRAFLRRAYQLCREHDVPAMVDEIQSCLWSPRLFMYREYGLRPSFVVAGKGFPGGEFPASRIIFTAEMDTLPQFAALVTNGQEELASLACLITMRWAEANAAVTEAVGEHYEARLRGLVRAYPRLFDRFEGRRHLAALCFRRIETAKAFARTLSDGGLDISVQSYKADCPPAALTKLPLIAGRDAVDFVVSRMDAALAGLDG